MPTRTQRPLSLPLCALAAFLFALVALAARQEPGGAEAASTASGRAGSRPNIVFILTDDQDLLLNSMSYMPAVRSLIAAQGLSFTNDYVPLSLCCPSRASIL